MSLSLYTNIMASYGIYKALPKLHSHYNQVSHYDDSSIQKRIYNLIHIYLEPRNEITVGLAKAIGRFQGIIIIFT